MSADRRIFELCYAPLFLTSLYFFPLDLIVVASRSLVVTDGCKLLAELAAEASSFVRCCAYAMKHLVHPQIPRTHPLPLLSFLWSII